MKFTRIEILCKVADREKAKQTKPVIQLRSEARGFSKVKRPF